MSMATYPFIPLFKESKTRHDKFQIIICLKAFNWKCTDFFKIVFLDLHTCFTNAININDNYKQLLITNS